MFERRAFLAVLAGGLVAVTATGQAMAAPAAAPTPDLPRSTADLRAQLNSSTAQSTNQPREMQYWYRRRRVYWRRRYYWRPRRRVFFIRRRRFYRCWWSRWGGRRCAWV